MYNQVDNAILLGCQTIHMTRWTRSASGGFCGPSRAAATTLYVGIDADEARRMLRIRVRWAPRTIRFPLTDEPELTKNTMLAEARAFGLTPPAAYEEGFARANFIRTTAMVGIDPL